MAPLSGDGGIEHFVPQVRAPRPSQEGEGYFRSAFHSGGRSNFEFFRSFLQQEIDAYLDKAKKESYKTVVELGTRGVQYASRVIMQTAINGGGGLMNTLRKSYSLGDVSPNQEPIRRRVNALPPVDENDRPASRVQPSRDDSDTEEFDDLADDFNDVTIEGNIAVDYYC